MEEEKHGDGSRRRMVYARVKQEILEMFYADEPLEAYALFE